jgi:radical SAM protein with 4Fe4S-binding SPASM domain
MYKQEAPFTVKLEFTEGCNLKCVFCGIHGIREKPGNFKFFTPKLAARISKQIVEAGWNSKIECAMHGEPLMNPKYLEIIRAMRANMPNQIMVSSNSIGLARPPGIKQSLADLFDAGLNVLVIDCYDVAEKVWSQVPDLAPEDVIVSHYPGGPSPNSRFPKTQKYLILIEDLAHARSEDEDGVQSGKLGNRIITNHIGAAAPLRSDLPWAKRCARPFRELSVRYDGQVLLCCNDWRGEFRCGDLRTEHVRDVWQNAQFRAARKMLYHRDRAGIKVCSKCDNVSFRVGLLPDKMGQVELGHPTKKDRMIVKEAERGRSMTLTVLRPWEK